MVKRNQRKVVKRSLESDEMTSEQFKSFADSYKRTNWGYGAQEQTLTTAMGLITVRKFPSGDTYIVRNGGQLEKLDKKWFDKKEKEMKENGNTIAVDSLSDK